MTTGKGLGQIEAIDLRRFIREIEALLANGTTLAGSANTMVLSELLERSKNRIVELDREADAAIAEERKKGQSEIAAAVVTAQREASLNMEERRQFTEFLEKNHFTKADFGSLEKFYQSAWGRLSEDGKAEMSERIWQGVRRKEYEFSELPEIVKQKEAERLSGMLREGEKMPEDLKRVPERDREDFLRAWEKGQREEAYQVLDRPVFAQNVATKADDVKAELVAVSGEAVKETVEKQSVSASSDKIPVPERLAKELSLGGVQLVDVGGSNTVAPTVNNGQATSAASEVKR